jgi:plastocyanin
VPGQKEYGILAAIDSRTNRIVWQKRTTYSLVGGSGALTTAGGLLFHLEPEGSLQAHNAKTGDLRWQFQTGYVAAPTAVSLGGGAAAATYEIDGQQFIAVAMGRGLCAFKLGGALPPSSAVRPPPAEYPLGGQTVSFAIDEPSEIAVGMLVNAGTLKQYWDEYAFRPSHVRVKVGTTVRWVNHGVVPHEITTRDGLWSTGRIAPGESGAVRFDKPGTYRYIC